MCEQAKIKKEKRVLKMDWLLTGGLVVAIAVIVGEYLPVIPGFEPVLQYYDLFYGLSLSFVVAYMFHYVVIVYPQKKAKKHIEPYVFALTKKVLWHSEHIVCDLVNDKKALDGDYQILDFYNKLSEVNLTTRTPHMRRSIKYGGLMDLHESVEHAIGEIREAIDELYRHVSNLDPELIEIINALNNSTIGSNSILEHWPSRAEAVGPHKRNLVLHTHYAPALCAHYKLTQRLQHYVQRRFPTNSQDYYLEILKAYEEKNWPVFLKLNRKVLKTDPEDRNAIYLNIKYLVELRRFEEAVSEIEAALEVHPNLHYNFTSEFKGEVYNDFTSRPDYAELIGNEKYKAVANPY